MGRWKHRSPLGRSLPNRDPTLTLSSLRERSRRYGRLCMVRVQIEEIVRPTKYYEDVGRLPTIPTDCRNVYSALIDVNRTHMKTVEWTTHLYCLVIDRVDILYAKPNTDEYNHCTISLPRYLVGTR
jgi:hypothetical protein